MKEYLMKVWAYFTQIEKYALMVVGGAVVLAMGLDFVGILPGVAKVFGTLAGLAGAVVVLSLGWRTVLKKFVH